VISVELNARTKSANSIWNLFRHHCNSRTAIKIPWDSIDDLLNSNLDSTRINDAGEIQNKTREIQCAIPEDAITVNQIQNEISKILFAF